MKRAWILILFFGMTASGQRYDWYKEHPGESRISTFAQAVDTTQKAVPIRVCEGCFASSEQLYLYSNGELMRILGVSHIVLPNSRPSEYDVVLVDRAVPTPLRHPKAHRKDDIVFIGLMKHFYGK